MDTKSMLNVAVEDTTPPVMRVKGEADYHNRDQIYGAVKSLLEDGHATLHADLTELRYMDSSALATLVLCANEARQAGGVIELTGASTHVSRVLNKCGAAMFFGSQFSGVPVCAGHREREHSGSWHFTDFALPATPEAASLARQRLVDLVGVLRLDVSESVDILIAFGEAVANAIRHGCGCDPRQSITVRFVADSGQLAIYVSDPGPGFRPGDVPLPSPTSVLDGGMGIYIMRELMDDVQFFFDGGTTTRLIKRLPAMDNA